jgi:hypothetical protein
MASVFIVDLACLACGRGRQLTVAMLTDLPVLPARCVACAGSVLAVSTSQRAVRDAVPHNWAAERPRLGRPPSRPQPPLFALGGGESTN